MKRSGKAMSVPAGIVLGVGISLLFTLAGAAIVTALISSQRMGEEAIGYGCMVILTVAASAGSICACGVIRHRKLMVCGIVSTGYYLMLLAVALLFGGRFQGMGITAVMVAMGGGIGLIPAAVGNRSGARRHKIARYR